jgi:hypothetical protein
VRRWSSRAWVNRVRARVDTCSPAGYDSMGAPGSDFSYRVKPCQSGSSFHLLLLDTTFQVTAISMIFQGQLEKAPGVRLPRATRRTSGVVAQVGRAAGTRRSWNHARPGSPCAVRVIHWWPDPADLYTRVRQGKQRTVRVGRRRSVTTANGRVAGSSPVVAAVECRGGVAQLAEQLPAVMTTSTRTSLTKSGPEFLRLSGDGSAGSSPAPRGGSQPLGILLGGDQPSLPEDESMSARFAPLIMAVAGRSEIGYLTQRSPRRRAARAIGSGRFASHARRRFCLPREGLAWMSCGR